MATRLVQFRLNVEPPGERKLAHLRIFWLFGIAIATGAPSPPAKSPPVKASQALSPTTAGCLLVSNAFAKHATDEKIRPMAQSVLYFYLGRLDQGMNTGELKLALRQQGRVLNSTNATGLMNACFRQMQAKGQ